MSEYKEAEKIKEILDSANKIVIVQADNPDADSLGSALALEQILASSGKETYLYCAVDMPGYLHYMQGWDRIQRDLPNLFDASIIVDASTMTLLEKLSLSGKQGWIASKPCIVLDHHEKVDNIVPFADILINDFHCSSTGELIYKLFKQLSLEINKQALEFLMSSILGDTQGLTNQLASAGTYKIMAEMIEAGVDRPLLEDVRRQFSKMPVSIYKYKADLIKRTMFNDDNSVAMVFIPQNEINSYSPLYNPAPLIQGDMLQTTGVRVAIVLKRYDDGKVTGAIRCNPGAPIGAKLADHFGGGGHMYASGFKKERVEDFEKFKKDCLEKASQLLGEENKLN